MRPAIAAIIELLLKRDERVLSLDLIGEVIGTEPISFDEIEDIYRSIENAGRQIDGVTPDVRRQLELVLREARRVKLLEHRVPTIESIAEATGLTAIEVRSALLFASVLGRP